MIIEASGATHIGAARECNEDNIYLTGAFRRKLESRNIILRSTKQPGCLTYAVFDGLGGGDYGETAAFIASQTLAEEDGPGFKDRAVDTILKMHSRIRALSEEENLRDLGTTASILNIENGFANIFSVGDSRVYLFRQGIIEQLSHDHTQAQTMIDIGMIEESDRNKSGFSHVLTQFVGMVTDNDIVPEPHLAGIEIAAGDIFIICSDGLTDEVSDAELCELMTDHADEKTDRLVLRGIKKAVDRNCRDDVSMIVVKVIA